MFVSEKDDILIAPFGSSDRGAVNRFKRPNIHANSGGVVPTWAMGSCPWENAVAIALDAFSNETCLLGLFVGLLPTHSFLPIEGFPSGQHPLAFES